MKDIDQLSDKVRKLLPEKLQDLDVVADGVHIFLTNVFKDGCVLGFWSHSPWGCVHDQEQGWAVLDKNLNIIAECETRTSGQSAGNDFRKWRTEQKEIHGSSFKLSREFENEAIWRITDT